jgi:multiple sugar transport system ATP-binding protein
MVTVRAGGALVAVKAPKEYRAAIGAPVSIAVPAAACHLFDAATGERIA